MALSQDPQRVEDLEILRQQRQHRRIFIVLLLIDLALMGFVVFDVLRLLGVVNLSPSSSESLTAVISLLK
jgi:hypothetical protein